MCVGFVYLAVILDAWSQLVVGYALARQIDTQLTLAALRAAINARHPAPGLVQVSSAEVSSPKGSLQLRANS